MQITKIETTIIETKNEITLAHIVQEVTIDQLKREERRAELYARFEKGKEAYNLTHYQPRYNGMGW